MFINKIIVKLNIDNKYLSGFTLIELIITISIFVMLIAVSGPLYSQWQEISQTDSMVGKLKTSLRLARDMSVSEFNNFAHGVYFDNTNNQFILYQGSSYVDREKAYDRVDNIDRDFSLIISEPSLDINFSKGLGLPSATATISIIQNSTGKIGIININALGAVEDD